MRENVSHQFDRLPETAADREVEGRPSREAVVEWWEERFGVSPPVFEDYTFWEKGAGRVWALPHELDAPAPVEALGLNILRTRQEHWKPTTSGVQRFGTAATRNVVELDAEQAERFVAGEDLDLDWEGDWGYLIAAHHLAGELAPIGVGLFSYGELKSMIPKGRRRDV